MGDDGDESGEREGLQEAEAPSVADASMREVQGLINGDVHMADEESEDCGMDVDGPASGEHFRFDEDEDEEEMHRPVVKAQRRFIVREESSCYFIAIKTFLPNC